MNILITGGNGFLGSNLVRYFINNHNVMVISNNNNNITDILNNIKFINKLDEKSIINFNPDIVIHCSWAGGNNYNDVNHTDQILKNIPYGIELLHIISKLKNKTKFIGFGSFAEYGILTKKAIETDFERPINLYGVSKNSFKSISDLYCKQHDISWTWIRPCYIYGPGDVSTRLIPSIINKLINNDKIILNSCDTIIDYLHIDDFCIAINEIIKFELNGVFNICSGSEYKISDIINFIHKNISTNSSITMDPNLDRAYSSKYICGSNTKLKSNSNWNNNISIELGLTNLIQYNKLNNKNK